jgi:serine/threonine protein kinase
MYMSPEELRRKPLDEQGDIFSLGVVVFEMVAGRPPFVGPDAQAIATQILKAGAPAPSAINGALPADLDAIALKMLSKARDQRYESAATVAAELRAVAAILDVREDRLEPVVGVRAPSPWFGVRPAVWVALAAIVIVALVLMAVTLG